MIAIGGGLLLLNTEKECEGCDIQKHLNNIEKQQKAAYVSLIAGGLCFLLDSHYQKAEPSNQALNFNLQPTYQGANLTMSYSLD